MSTVFSVSTPPDDAKNLVVLGQAASISEVQKPLTMEKVVMHMWSPRFCCSNLKEGRPS
jgi:hypothetical protein